MRSTRLQLLVTLAAVIVAVSFLVSRGLPPQIDFFRTIRSYDRTEIVRYLRWGGDPNTSLGSPLMYYAILNHDLAMVELLIDRGADVNCMAHSPSDAFTDSHVFRTPLSFAIDLKYSDIAGALRRHGGKERVIDTLDFQLPADFDTSDSNPR